MNFLPLNLILLAFATAVLTKSCTPAGGDCKDVKNTWPENCCDPVAGTNLVKYCAARDKRDWMNGIGTCIYRPNHVGRNEYKYIGTGQCSRNECYKNEDCCAGNYCSKTFGCIPRPGNNDPPTEQELERRRQRAEQEAEKDKLLKEHHLEIQNTKQTQGVVNNHNAPPITQLGNYVGYIPGPCVQISKCARKEEADSFHYIAENQRCKKIIKGSTRPCNIGYRNENICNERCLRMDKNNHAIPNLDVSLQRDYDDIIKWSNAPPAQPLRPIPAKSCSNEGEDCEPGIKLSCCNHETFVCRADYSQGEVQTHKWQCRNGLPGHK